MSCKCIEEMTVELEKHHANIGAIFMGINRVLFSANSDIIGSAIINFRFKKSAKGKPQEGNLIATFCPFCGKKYEN